MLQSITLENFRSFGASQTVPLAPFTVMIGANGAGKSSVAWVPRVLAEAVSTRTPSEARMPGAMMHRPASSNRMLLGWQAQQGSYSAQFVWRPEWNALDPGPEQIVVGDRTHAFDPRQDGRFSAVMEQQEVHWNPSGKFGFLRMLWQEERLERTREFLRPMLAARVLQANVARIREKCPLVLNGMDVDGFGLAGLVSTWRLTDPDKAARMKELVVAAISEVADVLVVPVSANGVSGATECRIGAQMRNGARLDADALSDGILSVMAVAATLVDLPRGGVLFLEEPEQMVHPLRLAFLVDALRRVHDRESVQVILSTHSTIVLNEFRDEPDSILHFRLEGGESRVRRVSDVPELVEALHTATPHDLLMGGFFEESR